MFNQFLLKANAANFPSQRTSTSRRILGSHTVLPPPMLSGIDTLSQIIKLSICETVIYARIRRTTLGMEATKHIFLPVRSRSRSIAEKRRTERHEW